MLKVELSLDPSKARPEFVLYGATALLDTGTTGIFVNMPHQTIKSRFGGSCRGETKSVNTAGTSAADVFELRHFQIGNLEFENVPVVAPKEVNQRIPAFLVGVDVFGPDSTLMIDNARHLLIADVQEMYALSHRLWMMYDDGKWHIAGFRDGRWVALYNDYRHFSLDEIA